MFFCLFASDIVICVGDVACASESPLLNMHTMIDEDSIVLRREEKEKERERERERGRE